MSLLTEHFDPVFNVIMNKQLLLLMLLLLFVLVWFFRKGNNVHLPRANKLITPNVLILRILVYVDSVVPTDCLV